MEMRVSTKTPQHADSTSLLLLLLLLLCCCGLLVFMMLLPRVAAACVCVCVRLPGVSVCVLVHQRRQLNAKKKLDQFSFNRFLQSSSGCCGQAREEGGQARWMLSQQPFFSLSPHPQLLTRRPSVSCYVVCFDDGTQ